MKTSTLFLLLVATLSFSKSTGRYNTGGFSSSSFGRNGSSTIRTTPQVSQRVKINTQSVSIPRPIEKPKPTPISLPSPSVAAVQPKATTTTSTQSSLSSVSPSASNVQKINTSALSNRGQPAQSAQTSVSTPAQTVSTPQTSSTQTSTHTVKTVQKTVVVHHYSPAPVVIYSGHPSYNYHGHYYPIRTYSDGRYYAEVDGRPIYLDRSGDNWQQDDPSEAVVAEPRLQPQSTPQPALQPAPQPQASTGMSTFAKVLLWIFAIAAVGVIGYGLFVLIRGDRHDY
jgi:hypothetical protein